MRTIYNTGYPFKAGRTYGNEDDEEKWESENDKNDEKYSNFLYGLDDQLTDNFGDFENYTKLASRVFLKSVFG